MWGLRTLLLLVSICVACVSRSTAVIQVFGFEGSDVNITFFYDVGYESYQKYLCEKDCGYDHDVLITTSQLKKGRFSISDDKSTRKVIATISEVSFSDAGKYWFGVTRSGTDIYKEVKLHITQDICCSNVSKLQGYEDDSVSITCPYTAKDQTKVKFVCRGNRPSTCLQQAVITSERTPSGRFTLYDNQTAKTFTVTIGRLSPEDSGPYLCGVQANAGVKGFSAVHLDVEEWCCARSTRVTGVKGQAITFQCPYPPSHRGNRKFLCKGHRHSNCTEMTTNGSRFMLQDDLESMSFSVTVLKLEAGDNGTYWCGSDSQWKEGSYTKIVLSVVLQQETHIPAFNDTVPASNDKPSQVTTLFIGFSVVAMVIILSAILAFVLWRLKRHKHREAEEVVVTDVLKFTGGEEETRREVSSNKSVTRQIKQSSCYYDDDEDQPDYENLTVTEEIYCNHEVITASVR